MRYVSVHFKFYDSSGNVENTGIVNMNNLGSGETWSFKKVVYENVSSGGRWGMDEITGF
jgi:hypothetical protein